LKTKNNFIVTFAGGDYALNENWRVCDLNSIEKHLIELGLKERILFKAIFSNKVQKISGLLSIN
jgi:hypothetical protein